MNKIYSKLLYHPYRDLDFFIKYHKTLSDIDYKISRREEEVNITFYLPKDLFLEMRHEYWSFYEYLDKQINAAEIYTKDQSVQIIYTLTETDNYFNSIFLGKTKVYEDVDRRIETDSKYILYWYACLHENDLAITIVRGTHILVPQGALPDIGLGIRVFTGFYQVRVIPSLDTSKSYTIFMIINSATFNRPYSQKRELHAAIFSDREPAKVINEMVASIIGFPISKIRIPLHITSNPFYSAVMNAIHFPGEFADRLALPHSAVATRKTLNTYLDQL